MANQLVCLEKGSENATYRELISTGQLDLAESLYTKQNGHDCIFKMNVYSHVMDMAKSLGVFDSIFTTERIIEIFGRDYTLPFKENIAKNLLACDVPFTTIMLAWPELLNPPEQRGPETSLVTYVITMMRDVDTIREIADKFATDDLFSMQSLDWVSDSTTLLHECTGKMLQKDSGYRDVNPEAKTIVLELMSELTDEHKQRRNSRSETAYDLMLRECRLDAVPEDLKAILKPSTSGKRKRW